MPEKNNRKRFINPDSVTSEDQIPLNGREALLCFIRLKRRKAIDKEFRDALAEAGDIDASDLNEQVIVRYSTRSRRYSVCRIGRSLFGRTGASLLPLILKNGIGSKISCSERSLPESTDPRSGEAEGLMTYPMRRGLCLCRSIRLTTSRMRRIASWKRNLRDSRYRNSNEASCVRA